MKKDTRFSRWAFLRVLTSLPTLGILIALVFGLLSSFGQMQREAVAAEKSQEDTTETRQHPAWAPIIAAEGKVVSGDRIKAMEELARDRVSMSGLGLAGARLNGADLTGADLEEADLTGANLSFADLPGADLSGASLSRADLSGADLTDADLTEAFLFRAKLSGANLSGADLTDADLSNASLSGADLTGAKLSEADLTMANLRNANIDGISWQEHDETKVIRSIRSANIWGIKNAPDGFRKWAIENGAVKFESEEEWKAYLDNLDKP